MAAVSIEAVNAWSITITVLAVFMGVAIVLFFMGHLSTQHINLRHHQYHPSTFYTHTVEPYSGTEGRHPEDVELQTPGSAYQPNGSRSGTRLAQREGGRRGITQTKEEFPQCLNQKHRQLLSGKINTEERGMCIKHVLSRTHCKIIGPRIKQGASRPKPTIETASSNDNTQEDMGQPETRVIEHRQEQHQQQQQQRCKISPEQTQTNIRTRESEYYSAPSDVRIDLVWSHRREEAELSEGLRPERSPSMRESEARKNNSWRECMRALPKRSLPR
ncbi:uncharacterized protein PADG_07237 [Paracoccidioides brasiliensis Pb18]|uniref:Uncharacterized protein n=1 Tax=Paracoccidioides brasiliensis (strain Pb18) TaxID=502780 RepID=C1GJ01_PARBD|nr:uncharacterized protein PADG_07237 [Paracoccidioides brasiliensis Pb18]EEH42417.2 hypothetical protein PADG_07237 [Paracoccidioides brasiliensis Pb18]